jgi:hypothetical protein
LSQQCRYSGLEPGRGEQDSPEVQNLRDTKNAVINVHVLIQYFRKQNESKNAILKKMWSFFNKDRI